MLSLPSPGGITFCWTTVIFVLFAVTTGIATAWNEQEVEEYTESVRSMTPLPYDVWWEDNGHKYERRHVIGTSGVDSQSSTRGAMVHWTLSETKLQLAVAVEHVDATGWIGFGISEAGGMPGSDIVLYLSSTDELVDAHAVAYSTPIVDSCQDWTLLNSMDATDLLLFEAVRDLDTSDLQDRDLKTNDSDPSTPSSRVIVAWGSTTDTYAYHGPENRVTGLLRFHGEPTTNNTSPFPTDMAVELKAPAFAIPEQETTYEVFCGTLEELGIVPDAFGATQSYHVVGMSFLQDPTTIAYTHHALVYGLKDASRCSAYASGDLLYIWAPGAEDLVLPPDAGFRTGGTGYQAFLLDMHYDNPELLSGLVDSSGVRIHYTTELRSNDAAVIQLADPRVRLYGTAAVTSSQDGVATARRWAFTCPEQCFESAFQNSGNPEEKITVFQEMQHMHAAGTRMEMFHYRNQKIHRHTKVDYYDFESSGAFAVVQEPYTVQSGDSFKTICYYSSTNEEVPFGLASSDEMCITFLLYYPALDGWDGMCQPKYFPFFASLSDPCVSHYAYEDVGADDFGLGRVFGTPCGSNPPSPNDVIPPSSFFQVISSFIINVAYLVYFVVCARIC